MIGGGAEHSKNQDDISAAHVFIDGTVLPAAWQYLNADEASGGTEVAMTAGVSVGTQGNVGFAGMGTAALIGNASTGTYVVDSGNGGNAATAGNDLLIRTDDGSAADYVIIRYTIEAHDVAFGKTRARIAGSFRDLVGSTSGDSVVVHVFHNSTELFTATGSAGRLTQANGTFDISDLSVQAGDTISFVVGSIGTSTGDEVALNASIDFVQETSPVVENLALSMESGLSLSEGIATLQFNGTPGLSYQVERTSDLSSSESWQVVDDIPFLPAAPYDVHLVAEPGEEEQFWRIIWNAP